MNLEAYQTSLGIEFVQSLNTDTSPIDNHITQFEVAEDYIYTFSRILSVVHVVLSDDRIGVKGIRRAIQTRCPHIIAIVTGCHGFLVKPQLEFGFSVHQPSGAAQVLGGKVIFAGNHIIRDSCVGSCPVGFIRCDNSSIYSHTIRLGIGCVSAPYCECLSFRIGDGYGKGIGDYSLNICVSVGQFVFADFSQSVKVFDVDSILSRGSGGFGYVGTGFEFTPADRNFGD